PNQGCAAESWVHSRDVAKGSAVIREELVALGIRRPEGIDFRRHKSALFATLHPTIHEREIKIAIQIKIRQDSAEPSAVPKLFHGSHASDRILEQTARLLDPQGMLFLGEMRHKQI